jgi:hypothetical protein
VPRARGRGGMYYRRDPFSLFLCVDVLVTVCGRGNYSVWLFYGLAGWVSELPTF